MFLLDNIAEPVLFLLAFLFYSLYSLSLFFFLLSWAHLLVSIICCLSLVTVSAPYTVVCVNLSK